MISIPQGCAAFSVASAQPQRRCHLLDVCGRICTSAQTFHRSSVRTTSRPGLGFWKTRRRVSSLFLTGLEFLSDIRLGLTRFRISDAEPQHVHEAGHAAPAAGTCSRPIAVQSFVASKRVSWCYGSTVFVLSRALGGATRASVWMPSSERRSYRFVSCLTAGRVKKRDRFSGRCTCASC